MEIRTRGLRFSRALEGALPKNVPEPQTTFTSWSIVSAFDHIIILYKNNKATGITNMYH